MGEWDPRKTSVLQYSDIVLVFLGQVLIFLFFFDTPWTGYLLVPAMVLHAAGLGVRAKRTGRSVLLWVLAGCFLSPVVPVLGIAFMIYRERKAPAQPERKPVSFCGHSIIASIIFLASAFVMDSFSLALICTVAAIAWVLSGRQSAYTTKQKMARAVIYAAAFALVIGAKAVNNRISQQNAAVVIAACDAYMKKNGTYPASLRELVPAHLPKVPAARYTWISGDFIYHRDTGQTENAYRLMYVSEAPFARQVYSSARDSWQSID